MNFDKNPKQTGSAADPSKPSFIPPGTKRSSTGGNSDNEFIKGAQPNALGIVALTENKARRRELSVLFGLAASENRALKNTADPPHPLNTAKSEIQQVKDVMENLGFKVTPADLPTNSGNANTAAKNWNTPDNVKHISDLLQAINKLNGDVPSVTKAT